MISDISNQAELPHPEIDVRIDRSLGSIILRRDKKRNALTRAMIDGLRCAFSDLYQEKSVRAVMITGAGTTFCAGTDLTELLETADSEDAQLQWFEQVNSIRELYDKMLRFPKPIIAAVNGHALGTGFGLVLAADIVIGCKDARFGFPESTRGLSAAHALPLLGFRIGGSYAGYLALTSQIIDNETAARIGIVHDSVSPDLLWAHCSQLADEIAKMPAESLSVSKRAMCDGIGENLSTLLSTGVAATATARTTEAALEGLRAFSEKRKPNWP